MKPIKLKHLRPEYLFFVILLAVGLLYNYHEILSMRPCGIHQWRSCVSAAFPVNFTTAGVSLPPRPMPCWQIIITSDITVVEFPLIYFIISLFYRVFGVNEIWFRLVQVAIGYMGLIYLFKASYMVTKDWFYAGVIPMIIFHLTRLCILPEWLHSRCSITITYLRRTILFFEIF